MPQQPRRIIVVDEPEAEKKIGPPTSSISGLPRVRTTLPPWMTAGTDASINQMHPDDMIKGAQLGLAMTPTPWYLQAPIQGALGAARTSASAQRHGATASGGDMAKAGALDAAFNVAGPLVGKAIGALKGPAITLTAKGWGGQETTEAVENALSRGLARLKPRNTGALQKEAIEGTTYGAPKTTKIVKEVDSPILDSAGNNFPSEEVSFVHEAGNKVSSPLWKTVFAHRGAVEEAEKNSLSKSPSIPAFFARALTNPKLQASAGQAAYSAATSDPVKMATAVRLALMELLGNK